MTTSLTRQNSGFDFESPVYRFGALQTTASNALCVPIIYGQVKAAGNIIWQGSGSTSFPVLVGLGEGQINGIFNVKLNDYDISSLSGCTYTPYFGDGVQPIDSCVTGNSEAERASLVGGLKYIAYLALKVVASNKVANNCMNVTADISGKLIKVYTDISTYTTKYSNNPAWCILDFLTSENTCKMDLDNIDIQSFINAAAYCDGKLGDAYKATGTVTITSGKKIVTGSGTKFLSELKVGDNIKIENITQKIAKIVSDTSLEVEDNYLITAKSKNMFIQETRFALNLILDERKARQDWLFEMLLTCRGSLVYNSQHKLSMVIEQDDAPVQDFTPDDIIAGSERFWTTSKDKRCDILKLRYIYPTEQCTRVFAIAEADTFLSNPPIIQEIEALGVTNFKQASRLAWFYLNQSNNCNKFISFRTTQVALNRTVGDVIAVTSTFLGYRKKKMRIVGLSQAQNGQIQIVCREYNGAESATLTTDFKKILGALSYTLKYSKVNDVTIEYMHPFVANQALTISVSKHDITVLLGTDNDGNLISTAEEVKSAIENNTDVNALVSVTYTSDDRKSDIVTTFDKILIGDINNNLVFSSVEKSSDADAITIQYVDPYAPNQILSVSAPSKAITINLATDTNGNVTTTAENIKMEIIGNPAASALVNVTYADNNNGSGIVAAMDVTNLAGGTVGLYSDTMGSVEPELNLVTMNDAFNIPEDVTTFQVTQVLSQVQFNWSEISGSGITYEIREGTSWDTGTAITGLTGNTFLASLNGTGTKYYWIKAITKYGYYSDNETGAILVVTDVPQLNVMVENNLLYPTNGTFDNIYVYNGKLKLASDGTKWSEYDGETWSENNTDRTYCQNDKWGCSVVPTGTYTSQVYDLGALVTSIFSLNSYKTYIPDDSSSIVIKMRTSKDNEIWDDWFKLKAGGSVSPYCRYYQLRATLNSPNKQQIYLTNCILTVDVPDRIEHYNSLTIADANAGYVLNFATNSQSKVAKSFNATPAVIVTPEAQSGIIITGEYSGKTKSSVTIRLVNASTGAFITGRFDCVVKGY